MKIIELRNEDKLLLCKRSMLKTINDELKNIYQIEKTKQHSISGFLLNIIGRYCSVFFLHKKLPSKKIL